MSNTNPPEMTELDRAREWLHDLLAPLAEPKTAWWLADAILSAPGVEVERCYELDPTGPRLSILLPREAKS